MNYSSINFIDEITKLNSNLNSFVWGPYMLFLLVGTGIYLSIRTKFPQFLHFGHVIKNTIGKTINRGKAQKGEMTPFQALATALASTVGVGNIAGVTGALVLGGPGAIFWMWVSGIFGMCTKFCEVTLAIAFREKNEKGDYIGGPMYYIKNGLGKKWKLLGILFAIFGALCALGIGNLTQINQIAEQIISVINVFSSSPLEQNTVFAIRLSIGIIASFLVGFVLIGGISKIGAVTERLVPVMVIVYLLSAIIILVVNIERLPSALMSIFTCAFNPKAIGGGLAGNTIMNIMSRGIARGVFSNEAGLGSAPMAHAHSSETNPVKQGLFGIFEVFVSTICICTLTALVVMTSGIGEQVYGNSAMADAKTTSLAFQSVFGPQIGSILIASALLLFAASTLLGWALYGMRCAEFLFGHNIIRPYEYIWCIVIVIGSVTNLKLVWDITDTLNGLMAIPNLIALLALSPIIIKLSKHYFEVVKKAEHIETLKHDELLKQ